MHFLHQLKHALFWEIRPLEHNQIINLSGSDNAVPKEDPPRTQRPGLPRAPTSDGERWYGSSLAQQRATRL